MAGNAWDSDWNPDLKPAAAPQSQVDHTIRPRQLVKDAALSSTQSNTISFNNDILLDWSRLGFTSARHVDLQDGALPPGFTVDDILGESNSVVGVVERVEVLGTFLAMKTYKNKTEGDRAEILAEIRILRRLRHHHIIDRPGQSLSPPTPLTSDVSQSVDGLDDDDDQQHHHEYPPSSPGSTAADEAPAAFTVPPVRRREYIIQWNQHDQRIDPPTVNYHKPDFDRIKKLNLCQYRYLMGHNYDLSHRDLDIFRALKRQQVCPFLTGCTYAACFSGHNRPNMRPGTLPEDRTKTARCCYDGARVGGAGSCYFPREMHDMDITVDYST
ncbi:hypothetical protein C8A00DRAFT_37025 [Chaetomidium leptoderma]|uniref:Tandem CCCH zinc finger domain-containing protein n=1 Tax=Chaetomidium leptoderma TaxID=669021 RepID=A0AAN6VFZ2_9PEZI|nr:hypothetical protein C8A00DRAFT_37025 [Chaetomidium leptoderma]